MVDVRDVVARSIKAARARAAAQEADRRKPEPIEITPEMLEAGVATFGLYEQGVDKPSEIVSEVFKDMLAARAKEKPESWLEIGPDGARGHIVLRPPYPPRLSRKPKDPA